MYLDVLQRLSQVAKTTLGGVLAQLREVAQSLEDSVTSNNANLPGVATLLSFLSTVNKSTEIEEARAVWSTLLDEETVNTLNSWKQSGSVLINSGEKFFNIIFTLDGDNMVVGIDDQLQLFSIDDDTNELVELLPDFGRINFDGDITNDNNIIGMLKDVVAGSSTVAKLQTLLMKANSCNWGDSNVFSMLQNVVSTLCFPAGIAADLISAVSGGPRSLINCVSALYQGTKDSYSNYQDTLGWNPTTIGVSEFSAGLLLQGVGTLIQAIGAVVTALNPVIGLIVTAVGAVFQIGAKLVNSYITNEANLDFTLFLGKNAAPCFSFVTELKSLDRGWADELLYSIGSSACTVIFDDIPCVYFIIRENDHTVVEEHLSIDYSYDKVTYKQNLANGQFWHDSVTGRLVIQDDNANDLLVIKDGGWVRNIDGTKVAVATTPTFFGNVSWTALMNGCRHPIDLGLWDYIQNTFDRAAMRDVFWYRLATALHLYFSRPLHQFMFDPENPTQQKHDDGIFFATPGFTGFSWPLGVCDFRVPAEVSTLCYFDVSMVRIAAYVTSMCAAAIEYYANNGSFSVDWRDALLRLVIHLFDGLPLHDYLDKWYLHDIITSSSYPNDDCFVWNLQDRVAAAVKSYSVDLEDMIDFLEEEQAVNFWHLADEWIMNGDITTWSHPSSWPNVTGDCQVTLPSGTWSGFILGLIVDGVIASTVVAFSVLAVVGVIAIRRIAKQSRWVADTKAFQYGEGTATAKEAMAADRKARLLEYATGGLSSNAGYTDLEVVKTGQSLIYKSITGNDLVL